MDRRSSSRQYGVEIGNIKVSQLDLELIRSQAKDILLSEHGFDVARAWVTATLNYLVAHNGLDATQVLKTDERPK